MTGNQHAKILINAHIRDTLGRRTKGLRKSGILPAVLYGKGQEAIPLQVPAKDFEKVFKDAGESTLVYLSVDGKEYPTVIHDVARDGVRDTIIHADFYKVNLAEKIKADVPVVIKGEAPVVKNLGGILVKSINELEVEALPQNLPHEIAVDVSGLAGFGDQITVGDINLGADVKIFANKTDILVLAQEPISEEK